MKNINIAVFDKDRYFLALLTGYCYAKGIAITALDFNMDGINQVKALQPVLTVIPLDRIGAKNKRIETSALRQAKEGGTIKICGLIKDTTDVVMPDLSEWIDIFINSPFDIGEFDEYVKENYLLDNFSAEERMQRDKHFFIKRRFKLNNNSGIEYKENDNSSHQDEAEKPGCKNFQIDQRNKCLFLDGHKINLTPKEFDLLHLMSTDVDRIFMADEIINHLWPESNRATKSDLYQYMHLLRKKIEKDTNNPQWIKNIKGFGYKLNISQ